MINKYRNKFETSTGEWLDERNVNFEYETERIEYTIRGKYIPDFIITRRNGTKLYIETKGGGRSFDGAARRKLIAVRDQHPEIDLRIVFYSNGKCGPKRKDGTHMTQLAWAEKNGFIAAIKEVPEWWLDE